MEDKKNEIEELKKEMYDLKLTLIDHYILELRDRKEDFKKTRLYYLFFDMFLIKSYYNRMIKENKPNIDLDKLFRRISEHYYTLNRIYIEKIKDKYDEDKEEDKLYKLLSDLQFNFMELF